MTIRNGMACALIAAAAGTTYAQKTLPGTLIERPPSFSADGEMPIGRWITSSADMAVLGSMGGAVPVDFNAALVALGTSPEADEHSDLEFMPDGASFVVANRRSQNLVFFDATTRALLRSIPVTGSPQSVAINPAGTRAVTANLYEGTASIVDLTNNTEITTIATGPFPATALITPDGTRALVHNNGRVVITDPFGSLSVINLSTNTVERTIITGPVTTGFSVNFEWQAAGFSSSGPVVYDNATVLHPVYSGSSSVGSTVLIIDINTGNTTPVAVSGLPNNIVVSGTKAYVIHAFSARKVTEIDVPTATVTRTWTPTVDLQGPAAINGAGDKLAVAVQNNFQILDLNTGTFSPNVATSASNPNALYRTRDGNHVIAVNFFGTVATFAGTTVTNFNGPSNYTIGGVSPTSDRAALVSAAFGEDMMLVNTTPGGVAQLSAGPTGPSPEADKPRTLAVNAAGTRAVTANVLSLTASLVDLTSNTVLATSPIQRRAGDVRISPNQAKAVIASRDGNGIDVIDMTTGASTAIAISGAPIRGDQVLFSPDSQFVYIPVITSGDGVWRVNLNTNTVQGAKIATGDMGSYTQNFNSFSGAAISPDGTRLVTCNSIVDTLSVIDTTTWTLVGSFSALDFPARAVFSPDGTKVYYTGRDNDQLRVFDMNTLTSTVGVAVGDSPTEIRLSADGTRAFVQSTQPASPFNPLITCVDLTVSPPTVVWQTNISPNPNWSIAGFEVSSDGSQLFVARGTSTYTIGNGGLVFAQNGALTTLNAATGAFIEEVATGQLHTALAASANRSVLAATAINADSLSVFTAPVACYANCDESTEPPILNVGDFSCFLARFANGDAYANCDNSTEPPTLNVGDFSCFLAAFANGCP